MKVIKKEKLSTGEEIIFRYPSIDDIEEMMKYINVLSKEETYIFRQGKQFTFEEEKAFVENILEKIEKKKGVMVLIELKGKIIGNSGIEMHEDAMSHVGEFGISIAKEFRGKGLGKKLMEIVLEQSKKMPDLKIICLGAFGENRVARYMYEKFGFKEYGWLPEGMSRKGKFDEHIFMYKKIR